MNLEDENENYMKKACKMAELGIQRGGGPFGCVIIHKFSGEIVGRAHNMVTLDKNPSLHAEIVAISHACHFLDKFELSDCVLYTSCEPCPMCLAAIYWSRIDTVYYGNSAEDAAAIGFDDKFIYDEFAKPKEERKIKMIQIGSEYASVAFKQWEEKEEKVRY
jgi:tRNA(Arg) A34 adenosine deaminase TadA